MADLTYSIGTVSVAANDTAVTGIGTLWESVNARQWDWISIDGGPLVPITDIADATHLTLALPSVEEKTNAEYVIYQVSPLRFAGGQAMADVSEMIARLRAKGLMWYLPAGYTKPQDVQPPLTADEGQSILRVDTHELWVMQGGSWVSAGTYNGVTPRGEWEPGAYNANDVVSHGGTAYMAVAANTNSEPPSADWMDLGAAGTAATVEVGTVTTGAPGSAANVTNSGDENAATFNFTIPRGSVVSVGSTTTGAPGSNADVADSGTDGDVVLDFTIPTGKGYGGTSATELTVGTGSHTFDIEAGLAYVVGDRVHIGATSAPLNWMEGFVTSYSDTSMTVAVSDVGGSGTFDAWGVGLTGKPGAGNGDMKSAMYDPDGVAANVFDSANHSFTSAGEGAVQRSVQVRLRDIVSVKDFGAKGDNSTDDHEAIQAALNSGAKKIIVPAGKYICGSPLTVPDWVHVVGDTYQPGVSPANAASSIIFNAFSGTALTCGHNSFFENLYFLNTAGSFNETTNVLSGTTASCIQLFGNATINRCSFSFWYAGVVTGEESFYIKTDSVEFNRCTSGYKVGTSSPYNMDIRSPISRLTSNFFLGNSSYPARNIKIIGGSIEHFGTAISGFLDLSLFGTYFETNGAHDGAFVIDPGVNQASVSCFGCVVYMNYVARFVNMSTRTDCMLTASGNVFEGTGRAGTIYYLPDTGSVALSGDRFGLGLPNNLLYVTSILAASKFSGIVYPKLPAGHTQSSYSGRSPVSSNGLIMLNLTVAPISPAVGLTVMADGSSWDPLSLGGGRPYWVIWQGDRWRALSG